MSDDEYPETIYYRDGIQTRVRRTVPWSDHSLAYVTERFWRLPSQADDCAAFFATFPADARVSLDEDGGQIEVSWKEPTSEHDRAKAKADAELREQEAADLAAFKAWKTERGAWQS